METEHLAVKCMEDSEKKLEASYFKKQDMELIKKLRDKSEQEQNQQYCEEHKRHCFKCGTLSLVEVERNNIKMSVCVNNNCGAIHLDPGEHDLIIKDHTAIKDVRNAIFSIFE